MGLANADFYAVPTYVPQGVTLSTVSINVGSSGAGLARIGVYLPRDDSFMPGPLKKDFGTFDVSTTGAKSVSPAYYLSAGWWWFAIGSNTGCVLTSIISGNSILGLATPTSTTFSGSLLDPGTGSSTANFWVTNGLPTQYPLQAESQVTGITLQASVPRILLGV